MAGRGVWGYELLERWCGLGVRMVEEQRRARAFHSLSEACAMREWRWLAALRRWRWRAADLLWGDEGLVKEPVSGARRRSWRVARASGTAVTRAYGIRVGLAPEGEEAGLDERAVHARRWWQWGGGRRRLAWLRRWEADEGREADSRGRWRVERLIEVARPAVRHGRQLDVHVAWAGADVADEGVAWGAGWVPITWLTDDLNLRARAMEADRYPVRPGVPPRTGSRKCARLNPMQTVPEEAAGSGGGWGEVFGMEEAGVVGGGVDAESGFGDWDGGVGGWSDGEMDAGL